MNPIVKPGIYEMTAAEYHADPCAVPSLSSTIAKLLVSRSPAHAHLAHPKLGGAVDDEDETEEKTSKEKELGTLIHRLMLGKGGNIVVIHADSFRTNAAKAERDAAKAAGNIPVLAHKLPEAESAAKSARQQLDAMGLDYIFRDGRKECVLVWQEGPIWLRAMIDNLHIDETTKRAEIIDLKTCSRSSHPSACEAQISDLGYDLSLEFYMRGLRTLRPDLAGRIDYNWVFVETSPPYAATPVEISGEWKMAAEMKTGRAIALWAQCVSTGVWPYYVSKRVRLQPKPWVIAELMTSQQE